VILAAIREEIIPLVFSLTSCRPEKPHIKIIIIIRGIKNDIRPIISSRIGRASAIPTQGFRERITLVATDAAIVIKDDIMHIIRKAMLLSFSRTSLINMIKAFSKPDS
jgi:hypothetical protein